MLAQQRVEQLRIGGAIERVRKAVADSVAGRVGEVGKARCVLPHRRQDRGVVGHLDRLREREDRSAKVAAPIKLAQSVQFHALGCKRL